MQVLIKILAVAAKEQQVWDLINSQRVSVPTALWPPRHDFQRAGHSQAEQRKAHAMHASHLLTLSLASSEAVG